MPMEAGVKQEARAARLSRPCPPNHKRLRVPGHPGLLLRQLPLIRHLMPVPPVCTRRAPVLTPQARPARSGLDTPPPCPGCWLPRFQRAPGLAGQDTVDCRGPSRRDRGLLVVLGARAGGSQLLGWSISGFTLTFIYVLKKRARGLLRA